MSIPISNQKKRRIALYGGSFNPPTIAHALIAADILNKFDNIDEVWLEPCGDNRPDKNVIVPAKMRYEMCQLVIEDILPKNLPVKVDNYELENKKYFPTYYLLTELQEKYPDCQFIFILGLDILDDICNWEEYQKLLEEFEFIIETRGDYKVEDAKYLPKKFQVIPFNFPVSSTLIREKIKENKNKSKPLNYGVNGLTSPKVIDYIIKNKLYQ